MSDVINAHDLGIAGGYIIEAAMQGDIDQLKADNAKLRELLQRLLTEYRYISVRPRKVYMQHERRMRVIEEEMRELGIELQ